jgi:hypothetical protein
VAQTKIDPQEFKSHFAGQSEVTEADIGRFLQSKRVKLNENTLRWHIHQLKAKHVLVRIKRGFYTFPDRPLFRPRLSRKIERIYNQVTGSFSPDLPCVIWSTEWLHEFMIQQPTQELVVLETPRLWTSSLFDILKMDGQTVFIDPSKEILARYVLGREDAFIVKSLVTRAPTQTFKNHIETPALEKILVDLICDRDLFATYQGKELQNIFLNSWKRYALNLSVLRNYAIRRKRLDDLLNFVRQLPDSVLSKLLSK